MWRCGDVEMWSERWRMWRCEMWRCGVRDGGWRMEDGGWRMEDGVVLILTGYD